MPMIELYGGARWSELVPELVREMDMVRAGALFKHPNQKKYPGRMVGKGMEWHYKRCLQLLWPYVVWHRWNELIIKEYLSHKTLVVMGPANSGKTHTLAMCVLLDYYLYPYSTTVIVCSTTLRMLEQRIWGEIKALHRKAARDHHFIPGNLIEGKGRIVSDGQDEISEGRDFRNGLLCVPAMQGEGSAGLGNFAGAKNVRMRVVADELSLCPRVFVDAIANLSANKDFKAIGLGNPKDTTDAMGVMAEPSAKIGGWDSNIDQIPKTKVWETRRTNGACVQLVGSDSPNLDGKLGCPVLDQQFIDENVSFYGKDSLQFTMMCQGMMPKGQGSRRVITRNLCDKFRARDEPIWASTDKVKLAALDAAYRGVGGDRCVLMFGEYGPEATDESDLGTRVVESLINQVPLRTNRPVIFALTETIIVPIKGGIKDDPEDQIATFVMSECEQRGIPPENLFYDSGMRTALVQSFARIWSTRTNSIDCGGPASDRKVSWDIDVFCRDYYSKRITELWYNVRQVIESGQFRGMTEDVMMEGCAREWTLVGANKIEVEPKEKMKLKTGRSPDLFDCLAVLVWGAITRGFVIRRSKSARQAVTDDRWKDKVREQAATLWKSGQLNHRA